MLSAFGWCRKCLVFLILLVSVVVFGTGFAWAQPSGHPGGPLAGEENVVSPEQGVAPEEQAATGERETVRVKVYAGHHLLFAEEVSLGAGEVTLPGGEVYRYDRPTALAALALALEQRKIPWAMTAWGEEKEALRLPFAPGPWGWFVEPGSREAATLGKTYLASGETLVVYPLGEKPPGGSKDIRPEEGPDQDARPQFKALAGENQGPEVEWEKTFGGSYRDYDYSVQQTSDGGYIVAGETYSYGAGSSDVYLIKTGQREPNVGEDFWRKQL